MFKFYFLLALLSSEIDGIYGGAFMFTQTPNPFVYFMNGSNAVVEWKYSVDNRMADFQYIIWAVLVGDQSTLVMFENATGHLTYTAAYAGRVEKRGQATLVLKDVTFKDSGIYLMCSLIHTSRIIQSDSSTGLTITGQASLQPQAQFASFLGSVVFICNATNVPKESFSWLKRHGQTRMMLVDNGQNVTINSAIGSSILTLKNVTEYNKGYYTCDATANVDQSNFVESYLQLPETLKLDGTFSSGRPIFAAVNETQKTLCCPVIGYPPPIVTWEKNGTMLQTGENKCFTIASVKSGHFGNYSCIATDGKTTTDPFVLSLVEKEEPGPTEIDRAPSNKTVFEYDDVVLHCNATGNPLPNITWTKYGTTAVLDRGNAFTIVNISRHQSGRYQCIASNGVNQTSSAPFVIDVLYQPSITSVTPLTKQSWVGQRVQLKCVADGSPTPSITWKKTDGTELKKVTSTENTVDAQMKSDQDFGNYSCEASNVVGAAALRWVQLNQIKPPESPSLTTNDNDIRASSLTVKWTAPVDDGGSPITGYNLVILHGQNVIRNETTSAAVREYLVDSLNKSTTYTLRVSAMNRVFQGAAIEKRVTTKYEADGKVIKIDVNVNVTEEQDVTLNCTTSKEAPSPKWSRKDGEAVETQSRVLKDDKTKLRITSASVRDAGIFICESDHDKIQYNFNVSVKVLVKVEMVVKVLNYQYTPQLQNKSSKIFKETAENFTAEMDIVYKNTPGYVRTEVLNFTKGSVKVDFRVIIIIVATDPKNESTITDKKAETGQRIIAEAKNGYVERLKVSPDVEIKAPPPDPRNVEIFDVKSDELSVRWIPPKDVKYFDVYDYKVQHRRFQTKDVSTSDIPASEGRDKYSYRIQNLEPETTYMISVAAVNEYGSNFNEESGHRTLEPPLATWIILLIVLGVIFLIATIIGSIVCFRRKAAERRRRQAEEGALEVFGNPTKLDSVLQYEEKNVKGLKFSFVNDSYKPSDVNWTEIPYENINLMDELGSGAFGVVYRGEIIREKDDATPCAVKAVKASASHEEIRDLYNELEIMTNVGYHPNLVNLLGACTKDGNLLVVLEIAENGSLLDFLKKSRNGNENCEGEGIKRGGLTEDMKLRIATDVAKGMAYLASHRCIHRDLAARNVLLGENYVAKVADYGMARDVYESLMYKKETQGKLPVKWMAIESLETYVFTVESDIWSYGVLLWEIESGGLKPYAGMTTPEVMTELKKGYRLEKPSGCSDAMYQVMRDCWNPNPKLRPSFEKLVERLEAMV